MPTKSTSGVPLIDFSTLGDLGQVYNDARITAARRSLSDLYPDGNIDPKMAAQSLLRAGDIAGARQVAELSQTGGALDLARERFAYEKAQTEQSNRDKQRALQQYMGMGGLGPQTSLDPGTDTGDNAARGSWYSQYDGTNKWVDRQDRPNSNALGVPDAQQGIALPTRQTLGQWFDVTAPDGTTHRLQQTDVGPARWTGRGIDISAAAADKMGYSPRDFPTGANFTYRRADGPPQAAPVPSATLPPQGAQAATAPALAMEPQLTNPVQIAQQGSPQGLVSPPTAPQPAANADDEKRLRWVMANENLPAGIRKEAEIRLRALIGAQYSGQKRESPEDAAVRATLEARAKKSVDAESETRDAARAANKQLDRLSMISALADRIQTGATFPTNIKITAIAKDMGLPDSWASRMGLKPGQLADAQTFRALANEWAMGKIGAGGIPANNFSEADRNFLVDTVGNLGDDPKAIKLKIEMGKRVSRLEVQRQSDWARFSKENPRASYYEFEDKWNQDLANKDMFGDLAREAQGMFGPPKTGTAPPSPGAAQPQAPAPAQNGRGGARQAPDGNWYLPDPNRPGKYLRVD